METINEKKANKYILMGFIINYISLLIFSYSISSQQVILGAVGVCGWMIGIIIFGYNCYSLGWEYKRIELNNTHKTE